MIQRGFSLSVIGGDSRGSSLTTTYTCQQDVVVVVRRFAVGLFVYSTQQCTYKACTHKRSLVNQEAAEKVHVSQLWLLSMRGSRLSIKTLLHALIISLGFISCARNVLAIQ